MPDLNRKYWIAMGTGPQQQMDIIGLQQQSPNRNAYHRSSTANIRSQILDRNKYYRILIAKSGSQLTMSNLNLHFPIVMDIIAPQFQITIYDKDNFNHKCSLNHLQQRRSLHNVTSGGNIE